MRSREHRRGVRGGGIVLSILIVIVYLLLFPREMESELLVTRGWTASLRSEASGAGDDADGQVTTAADEGETVPFQLGEYFGLVTERGEIRHRGRALFGAALDQGRFSNFSRVSETIVVQDWTGALRQSIPEPGYPLLDAGRTLLFSPDGRTLSEWTPEDGPLWRRQFPSLVTDVSVARDAVGVAFLDGSVGLVIEKGGRMLRFEPRGSRIGITYGVAVNADASLMAAVSGLDPQRLTVLETSSDRLTPVRQRELENAYRRPVFLEFLTRDLMILEQRNAALLVDVGDESEVEVPVEGTVFQAAYLTDHGLVALLSRAETSRRSNAILYLLRPTGELVLKRTIGPGDASIQVIGSTVVLGADEVLLGIPVEEG
ncbi:MAG: hypothetical protein ACLFO1_07985 [Spirochaetaceae bacterium]